VGRRAAAITRLSTDGRTPVGFIAVITPRFAVAHTRGGGVGSKRELGCPIVRLQGFGYAADRVNALDTENTFFANHA
jgi:hypothetical protein